MKRNKTRSETSITNHTDEGDIATSRKNSQEKRSNGDEDPNRNIRELRSR